MAFNYCLGQAGTGFLSFTKFLDQVNILNFIPNSGNASKNKMAATKLKVGTTFIGAYKKYFN